MRRTTVFLDLGPIHPHPLTARPRGRIYSPPAGDHNHSTVSTLLRLQAKVHTRLQEHSFLLTSPFFLFFYFLLMKRWTKLSTVSSHWQVLFPRVWWIIGGDGMEKERFIWSICIFCLKHMYIFFVRNVVECVRCGPVSHIHMPSPSPFIFAPTTSLELKQ